jgi:hypothetical protein
LGKRVKIQRESREIISANFATFTKPEEQLAKLFPVAGIELDTRCKYSAIENREADAIKTSSRVSLTLKKY